MFICSICRRDKTYKRYRDESLSFCIDCGEKEREAKLALELLHSRPKKHRKEKPVKEIHGLIKKYKEDKKNLKLQIVQQCNNICPDCNNSWPWYCFDFHHLDQTTKLFEIGTWDIRTSSWESLLEEIDKCILICGNCHKIRHHSMK